MGEGGGQAEKERKKKEDQEEGRKGETEKKEEKEERTNQEGGRQRQAGRRRPGKEGRRGEHMVMAHCHPSLQNPLPPGGHHGSSQETCHEQASCQPPTTSSNETATHQGPPWPRLSETDTPDSQLYVGSTRLTRNTPEKKTLIERPPCAEDAKKGFSGVFQRPMGQVSTFPYHLRSSKQTLISCCEACLQS